MKAYIAAVLEDLVGEYVLNISKENLKLAALRGKIKLENVEIDGDLIGSHILGAVGLSGFGVLSCWAKSLKINIPLTNLDAPTSMEIHGMHLVAVPLLPTTANRKYHGPQTLRTRAKRSAIARYERNYFSGRIADEGPQQEIYLNDNDDEDTLSYNGRRRRWSSSEDIDTCSEQDVGDSINTSTRNAIEISLNKSLNTDSVRISTTSTQKEKEAGKPSLKKKLKAKIYENLVSSVNDIHVRCELPEGGLNMSLPNQMGKCTSSDIGISDQNAFAFGLTLKSISVRNVSAEAESSSDINGNSNGLIREDSGSSSMSDVGTKKHKKVEIEDLSIYWDDDPSFLITESDLFDSSVSKPNNETMQQLIADTMKQMSRRQDPGYKTRLSISNPGSPTRTSQSKVTSDSAHNYICSTFSQSALTTLASDAFGNSLSFAEVLPCSIDLNITSQQYKQYNLLKNAILSQQRFDTMFHRRPQKSPLADPRGWWKYAIACVKHQATSRPWSEVQKIVKCRNVYIDLVVKNLSASEPQKGGFHGGLSDDESRALSELEDYLPIETLLAFHLIALRKVFASRGTSNKINNKKTRRSSMTNSFAKKRSSSTLGRLLNSISGSNATWQSLEDDGDDFLTSVDNGNVSVTSKRKSSASKANTPTFQSTCQLHQCKVRVCLLDSLNMKKILTVEFDVKGNSYSSDSGRGDLSFDILRFEVFDHTSFDGNSRGKVLAIEPEYQDDFDCRETVIHSDFMEEESSDSDNSLGPSMPLLSPDDDVRLPPTGVVCQVSAVLDHLSLSLDICAHPATLIWNKPCAEAAANFFSSTTHEIQNHFLTRLRAATTPDAHRAHLAVFHPNSLSITIDASAPKLWIPVSPQMLDGALFVDTGGNCHIKLEKAEQTDLTEWNMDVTDIQIMLAGEISGTVLGGRENDAADLDGVYCLRKELTTIVHPFQINVTGQTAESFEEPPNMNMDLSSAEEVGSGQVSVNVGRIRLNLVDVEDLAKAIGRYYASGVGMMKNKSVSMVPTTSKESASFTFVINVCFDKLEIALEQYSSQRTYLMEIFTIKLEKKNKGNLMSFSRLSISDFTIVQLADVSTNQSKNSSAIRYLKQSNEPQHQLLARQKLHTAPVSEVGGIGNRSPSNKPLVAPQTPTKSGVKSKTHLRTPTQLRFSSPGIDGTTPPHSNYTEFIKMAHYRGQNVDEVEFDIASAIIKVTPTSISDCTMWLARAIELIRVASKEMERRVHDRRRQSRPSEKNDESKEDSSIIVRVTFSGASILVGRPSSDFIASSRGKKPSPYVMQICTNASIIIQSIENDNDTGSRTFHISLDNLSASVIPTFELVTKPSAQILQPTAIDCRAVYDIVGEGHVLQQTFSSDCESMEWCFAPHDIRVTNSIVRKVIERLQSVSNKKANPLSRIVHSQQKGSRVATRMRLDLHSLSLTLTQAFKDTGIEPFIEINTSEFKVNLDGCIDAMSGEVVAITGIKFFNPISTDWEDIVQANRLIMVVEQLPNELGLAISSPDVMNINVTSGFIQAMSNIERTSRHNVDEEVKSVAKRPPTNTVNFVNSLGIEVVIGIDVPIMNPRGQLKDGADNSRLKIAPGSTVSLDSLFSALSGLENQVTLSLDARGRQTLQNLPLHLNSNSSKQCTLLYKWQLITSSQRERDIEPVTEIVIQNERMRPGINDVFSLERGQDLLSSSAWSPASALSDASSENRSPSDQLWLPPYLKDDAFHWSDFTHVNNTQKDDFTLPDESWMWINDWEVLVNDDLERNDADGWEYATDFETFGTCSRSYQQGDLVRRRRWTRTRMVKQSKRTAPVVWEINGNVIKARSHLQLHNHTEADLSFFGFCHSSGKDKYIGRATSGDSICVPLELAMCDYISLAIPQKQHTHSTTNINNYFTSDRFSIQTTAFTSNKIIRACIRSSTMRKLHFVLTLKCVEGGVVDLHIDAALTVINLLPCQLECQLGEIGSSFNRGARKISQTDIFTIGTGKEMKCLPVDCYQSPHISVRVPGYKWSCWKKIVNRESNPHTWRPTEEDTYKDSTGHNEFETIIHFDHKKEDGCSIDIIMSVEMGHSPTLKLYAQYLIIDKTLLGLNFTGGFTDLMQTEVESETLRKSYLLPAEVNDLSLEADMKQEGHEWSLGTSGMSLFFSRDERIAVSVGVEVDKSKWSSLIDVSKVMPSKTAISIDQNNNSRRYELAYNITLCPSIFSRTRMITLCPKYEIFNLLPESLYIAQDGGNSEIIPSQSSVHFHWENSALDPKIRLCSVNGSWSHGCVNLDKIGVSAMRIPSSNSTQPKVVHVEVRLATSKKQDSALLITIWETSSVEMSNPLYLLKNTSSHTIFCKQHFEDDKRSHDNAFIWRLSPGRSMNFGFDDPELPHLLAWTWSARGKFANTVDLDEMGSTSSITMHDGTQIQVEIQARASTKVILFSDNEQAKQWQGDNYDDDNTHTIDIRIDLCGIAFSVIDNISDEEPGREIFLLTSEGWHASFKKQGGFHEIELRLTRMQIDNFIFNAEHPVLVFCPSNEDVPFLHLSAVGSIQDQSDTCVVNYCALRILDIDISLDRKTAEKIAQFLHPIRKARDERKDIKNWSSTLTDKMKSRYSNHPSRLPRAARDAEKMIQSANTGRVNIEQLQLHPLRLSLTFTQEGMDWNNPETEGLMIFQLIRGMASIADAPLIFTSFVVSHAFESPQTLLGILSSHYTSQLSNQILSILGSLVILKTPADILSNVGTGVRDFFYEPIKGLVHSGPAAFFEGLENGTSSLARGVVAGAVRGASASVELVSDNLANLTDDAFIGERISYHKKFMQALKADHTHQAMLVVAGTLIERGFSSGVKGIYDQPTIYASRQGAAGLVKGVGKAMVGAIIKPVVGVGDAAAFLMNHMTEKTVDSFSMTKINKRMRRALPHSLDSSGSRVKLIPYDERSARAQQIVTSGETEDDAYIGHVQSQSHLIIVSAQFLWLVDESTSQRIRWADIKSYGIYGNQMKIHLFSGPTTYSLEMNSRELTHLSGLLSMKMNTTSNGTGFNSSRRDSSSYSNLPGVKTYQAGHVFGSVNRNSITIESSDLDDASDGSEFINKCYKRVNRIGSFMSNYFLRLDQESWLLASYVDQKFKGLSSRRCIVAGMINGTNERIQVKNFRLIQGGSPCFTFPTIEYDRNQGILHPGGAIIFFGWSAVPSLLQPGNVILHIETNIFVSVLSDSISQSTSTQVLPTWHVDFLEKSYDNNEWWAKYWILIRKN